MLKYLFNFNCLNVGIEATNNPSSLELCFGSGQNVFFNSFVIKNYKNSEIYHEIVKFEKDDI